MKVAVLGASGLLGKALLREWRTDEVAGFSSSDIDIRDGEKVSDLISKLQPHWVVLAAAYTDVDECERQPELAFAVNRDGAVNVARAAQASGSRMLFLSSDYVFDGTQRSPYETAAPRSALGVYGQSKAQAELRLLEMMPEICIVRTSWLFGVDGKCFPDTIMRLAESRAQLDVVDDQRGSPTYTVDLGRAIIQLCRLDAKGIIHATNSGDCTWFEFAREIVARVNKSVEVRPTSTAKVARPAPRPAYSVLSSSSLIKCGVSMPGWPNALQRYFAERSTRGPS